MQLNGSPELRLLHEREVRAAFGWDAPRFCLLVDVTQMTLIGIDPPRLLDPTRRTCGLGPLLLQVLVLYTMQELFKRPNLGPDLGNGYSEAATATILYLGMLPVGVDHSSRAGQPAPTHVPCRPAVFDLAVIPSTLAVSRLATRCVASVLTSLLSPSSHLWPPGSPSHSAAPRRRRRGDGAELAGGA